MYSEKIVQKPGEGTLVFSKLEESDEGTYQCEAYNSNGTAVSRPTRLQHTCKFILEFFWKHPLFWYITAISGDFFNQGAKTYRNLEKLGLENILIKEVFNVLGYLENGGNGLRNTLYFFPSCK